MHVRLIGTVLALASGSGILLSHSPLHAQTFNYSLAVNAQPSASDRVLGEQSPGQEISPSSTTTAPTYQLISTAPQPAKPQVTGLGAYPGVFYANDYSYLRNPAYSGPYFPGDALKGLDNGKLDLGGEYRTRFHHENNHRGFGLTGVDDEFWLSRLRLFANYRVNDTVRFYGEFLYADSSGESSPARAIEENRGDAQNLFFDVKLLDTGAEKISARLGRQELLLGAQRLVSPLDWANTRRTFDGYRLTYSSDDWEIDGFYTNPVSRVPATAGSFDWDSADTDQHFFGTYLSRKGLDIGTLDVYYLGYDNENANFAYHTLGSRLAGKNDLFLYDFEGGTQFGENSNGSGHGAGFVTGGLGKQLTVCSWKPTLWAYYDWASGGGADAIGVGDNGFHHNFPLAHKYNGFMDLFGRRNLNDVNVQLTTPVGKRVNMMLWYHYFFLDQATTPYSVAMQPYNTTDLAASKDLGHEIDYVCSINLNERNSVLLGYSFFNAGEYYQSTPNVQSQADADFFYFQYQTQF
ncbi:alginate export family protein [Aureliella helgolandensis]|nr:alginate export family protein [Aureliella helgolandensis]